MGYLTTFTIYNDDCDLITKYPKEFAEIIYEACFEEKMKSYSLNHCSLIIAQGRKHADEHTIYVHAGNTVCEMSQWSDFTKDLMRRNPKYFKTMLNMMDWNVKELKKQFKDIQHS